ncbi:hypothetical protein AUP68_08632 [Ilyonectria robusta]
MAAWNHNETLSFTSENNIINTANVKNLGTTFPGAQEAVADNLPPIYGYDVFYTFFSGPNSIVPTAVALMQEDGNQQRASYALKLRIGRVERG